MILRSGHWDNAGAWQRHTASSDLRRVIGIALRRSTESELVELLTSNVAEADDLGRFAAWRLWWLVNSRRNADGYGRARLDAGAASPQASVRTQ